MEWMAFVYRTGRGTRRDLRRALAYNLQGAALGHVECVFNAGDMYSLGEGTRRNYRKARDFLARAAADCHIRAMVSLGVMLWHGEGGPRDRRRALRLYRRAARHGDAYAYFNLGLVYRDGGDQVRRDLNTARSYFQQAAASGHPCAGRVVAALDREAD
jgi:TPR repeat protein